jgi:hypothetical protein
MRTGLRLSTMSKKSFTYARYKTANAFENSRNLFISLSNGFSQLTPALPSKLR